MADIEIRKEGRAGRITLARPQALNALTYEMCLAIDEGLRNWAEDPQIALVLIGAQGDRAFCAGGDIADMYATGTRGDYGYGRCFWRDEYRMNARIAEYPKPVVSFLHGFTMGGGVGVGCHGSHRIVGESSQIAMPECGIGLVPDVGGSFILASAPGRLGAYLGMTGARMGPGDAILAGFADHYVPEEDWPALTTELLATGETAAIGARACAAPAGRLAGLQPEIDALFGAATLAEVARDLNSAATPLAQEALAALGRAAPLSAACALEMFRQLHARPDLRTALGLEYRFTWRAMESADFLEGIRAQIIDKDRRPRWRHDGPEAVTMLDVAGMLAPLGADELTFEKEEP